MSSSTKSARKIMIKLNRTEKSISSFSLYSMHYFQILNWRDACFPALLSPKEVMFCVTLSVMDLRSEVSIKKKH
jgi:hypothetical protein